MKLKLIGIAIIVAVAATACAPQRHVANLDSIIAPHDGEWFFEKETVGGNGRTCATCHRQKDAFSTRPATAQALFAASPTDPLFQPIDSDDGLGHDYSRLLTHATIRVKIPLKCQNIWLEDDPAATSVVLNRGIPELLNTPALDPNLMSDGRLSNLEQQASAAIHDHIDPSAEPDAQVAARIADYERSDKFFSSDLFRQFAHGGPAPELPAGNTPEEVRGRTHFLPHGLCGRCHGGPMLNTTTGGVFVTPGQQFQNIRTGELVPDQRINPPIRWHVVNDDGSDRVFNVFADPGRILVTCDRRDLTVFKIRSLWNVRNTAPYFHDNSAKTLEDVIAHYRQLFTSRQVPFTESDLADALAYLRLL
jgi:cytochrome c peroxidase